MVDQMLDMLESTDINVHIATHINFTLIALAIKVIAVKSYNIPLATNVSNIKIAKLSDIKFF